jgi:16S rRNA (guanine1207-N2)-methyltransferase
MPHYYSERQSSLEQRQTIKAIIHNKEYSFLSASGVFSKGHVDKGTLLLANNMTLKKGDKLLDIGCGIGILGIVAANLGADVAMSDVNSRAVSLAKKNTKLSHVNATIIQGNLYEKISDNDFDVILSNPPQSAGKAICFAIIEGAKNHLKDGGSLQLVARPNKGGKTLAKKMEEVFGNVGVVAKGSTFAVYLSRKGTLELPNAICSERD